MAKKTTKSATKTASKTSAKPAAGSVYKVIEIVGTSKVSWADAAKNAVATTGTSLRDLRVAEVTKLDVKVGKGGDVIFRAKMSISFKYHAD